jgi:hypothetical protein
MQINGSRRSASRPRKDNASRLVVPLSIVTSTRVASRRIASRRVASQIVIVTTQQTAASECHLLLKAAEA